MSVTHRYEIDLTVPDRMPRWLRAIMRKARKNAKMTAIAAVVVLVVAVGGTVSITVIASGGKFATLGKTLLVLTQKAWTAIKWLLIKLFQIASAAFAEQQVKKRLETVAA